MFKSIKINTERFFVAAALIFGMILIFLTPPLQSPDEQWHFFRAYSVAQGDFVSKKQNNMAGNAIPAAFPDFSKEFPPRWAQKENSALLTIKNSLKIHIDHDNQVFTDERQQALYSPAAYLPQSLGIFTANHFTSSVYWLLISGKVFLLAFYTLFGYFAIKSMPFLKELTALTLLMPMSLSLGASVSADGVLIAVSVLFFAIIMQLSFTDAKLTKKSLFFLIFLAIMLALTKQSVLLALFMLLLTKENTPFKTKILNSKPVLIIFVLFPAFIASILWSCSVMSLYVPLHGANPALQTEFILQNPLTFLHSLYISAAIDIKNLLFGFIGILGYLNIFLAPFVYYFYIFVIILNLIFSKNPKISFKSTVYEKFMLIFVTLLNILTISTIIYISWIAPHTAGIWDGLQSRYFIPLAMPVYTFLFLQYQNYLQTPQKLLLPALNTATLVITYSNLVLKLISMYYV